MALQLQLENGSLVGGGGVAFNGANVQLKPFDHGALGHYRLSAAVMLVAAQAVNSRLFSLRNAGSQWIIPTEVRVSVLPIGPVAVPYVCHITMNKCTGFTAVDSANTVTPLATPMKTGMPAAPGGAVVRHVTALGHASGMTGGTMTEESALLGMLTAWMASVSTTSRPVVKDFMPDLTKGGHPPVFQNNEGWVLRNVALGSATSNQVIVLLDIAWAEVPVGGF